MALLVPNVTWEDHAEDVILVARHLGLDPAAITGARLVRRSLDARQRRPRWVGVFRVELPDEASILARRLPGVRRWIPRDAGRYGLDAEVPPRRRFAPSVRPIVVGAGPAGLFAALYLAESGAPVRLLERGGPVEERIEAVNGFWRGRAPLDPENNLVFGEGGAGTFSDGKIYTRRRDGELGYIFQRLISFGADPASIAEAWAHLGTDRIRALLPPFRRRLQELGVEVCYHQRVVDLRVEDGRCVGVELADGAVVEGGPVLVATGHSARDAIEMMVRAGAEASPRGIAIGARVEHPQALIDRARYGTEARGELPPASYRLAFNPSSAPAARTFCMCPGGVVVPAMNHPQRVVVNGMSFAARRAFWSNSAVIVEIDPRTYGADDPLAGFRWQDAIERAAFVAGGETYAAPAQRVADFLVDRPSREVPRTSYPLGIVPGDLRAVLPDPVVRSMQAALLAFEGKLEGFAGADGVLIAPETRTTSPVRFHRDERGCSTVADLFPVGEGAGFAGGIVSSALDGLSAARAICAEAGLD
ncbi:MAG TPA: FAD-binding protein [Deltaproteobacteria bacterium]|nr:FAD-binding protein [Deltaproteobacteria bacterium]